MHALLALVLLVLPSAHLDTPVARTQVPRVKRLASGLHIGTRLPSWTIIVTDDAEYQRLATRGGVYGADEYTAFTVVATRTTYVNAGWLGLKVSGPTDKELRHTLAHEAGHLISGSADEDVADATGAGLL